jgi:hypothetical protein
LCFCCSKEERFLETALLTRKVHWFDLEWFYKCASQVLKPGGTVAIWTGSQACCRKCIIPSRRHSCVSSSSVYEAPSSPNADVINAIFDEMQECLKFWMLPGNIIAQELYETLAMPWDFPDQSFTKTSFTRFDWSGDDCPLRDQDIFVAELGPLLSTASPFVRWRNAHPFLAGTSYDPVRIAVDKTRKVTAGKGFKLAPQVCLLLFQKSRY